MTSINRRKEEEYWQSTAQNSLLHSIGLWRVGKGNADGADEVFAFEPLFNVCLKHEIDKELVFLLDALI